MYGYRRRPPSFQRSSVTGIFMIINIIVFIAWHTLPFEVMYTYFVAIPGILTPGSFLANISHESLYHIFANMYLLAMLGPLIQSGLSDKKYIGLLVASAVVTSLGVFFFSSAPTLGFSGIGLGMIAFAYVSPRMYFDKQQLGTLLFINIAVGLLPGVSFVGHAAGAIGGALYALALDKKL